MAKDKGSKEAAVNETSKTGEVAPDADGVVDPDMQGAGEFGKGQELNFRRLWFKSEEAGEGSVLQGFMKGCIPVQTKYGPGEALEFDTTIPCKLTNDAGETKLYPKGTPAIVYCTEALMDLRPLAVHPKKVLKIGIRAGKRVQTGSGNNFQPFTYEILDGRSYDREEIGRLSVNPAIKMAAKLLGMDPTGTAAPPVLPQ